MENLLTASIATCVLLIACAKDPTRRDYPHQLVIDSVVLKDSTKVGANLTVGYSNTILLFPSIKDKALLDSIYFSYGGLKRYSENEIMSFVKNDMDLYFTKTLNENKEWLTSVKNTDQWYEKSSMKLISFKEDFMHLQYSLNSYMGGAHGNYGFQERVFDLKNKKKVLLSDITTIEKDSLTKLLNKNINVIPSKTTDDNGIVKNSEMLLVENIPVSNNFYFDHKNLYFHYSPYEIAAYAAGDITIPVSWKELDGTLVDDFKKRLNL